MPSKSGAGLFCGGAVLIGHHDRAEWVECQGIEHTITSYWVNGIL